MPCRCQPAARSVKRDSLDLADQSLPGSSPTASSRLEFRNELLWSECERSSRFHPTDLPVQDGSVVLCNVVAVCVEKDRMTIVTSQETIHLSQSLADTRSQALADPSFRAPKYSRAQPCEVCRPGLVAAAAAVVVVVVSGVSWKGGKA